MSKIANIRTYITNQLEELGFKEHLDVFNDENIPSNILDMAFHQQFLAISSGGINNSSVQLSVPVQVKVFKKGFRNVNEGLTQSIDDAESIISAILPIKNYKSDTAPITSVLLDSLDFEPYSGESNDNVIVSVFVFNFVVYVCTD